MKRDRQFVKFCVYGFLKNLRFFDVFLLLFFLENGISFSQIGILYAIREIIINIAEIPSGLVADSYGRKSALLAAFLFYIMSFVVFFLSVNFALLLVGMLLLGIGDAFRSGTHKGMIMDYLRIKDWDDQKIEYYGETRAWSQIGSAASALMAGIMVFYAGEYRTIYLFAIIPYLLNFANIYSYPEELNHSIVRRESIKFSFRAVLKSVIDTLKKERVAQLVNSSALHSAYLKAIKDYIQPLIFSLAIYLPLWTDLDSKSKGGLAIGIVYFIIYILTASASKNSSKILAFNFKGIEQKTLLLGLFLGIGTGIFYHYGYLWISLVLFVLIYIAENLRKPILTGFLADNVPNEILTSVLSVQSFYKTIATATIAILLGFLAEKYGIGIGLLSVSALLIMVTILLERSLRKKVNNLS